MIRSKYLPSLFVLGLCVASSYPSCAQADESKADKVERLQRQLDELKVQMQNIESEIHALAKTPESTSTAPAPSSTNTGQAAARTAERLSERSGAAEAAA